MPIYTYRCKDCDYQFEKRQRMADDPLTECIHCEEGHVRRVVNSVGIVFKGSGFYQTDYRSAGYQKAKAADKPVAAAPKKDKKSASKKDAKKAQ